MNPIAWQLVVLAWLWPFGGDDGKDAATIESLEKKQVEIPAAEPLAQSREQAMANYRAFLEMASRDPVLQAEAMRRLADLELEHNEEQRADAEAELVEQWQLENAIGMYTRLLAGYPDYEHNDRVLYQLARAYESTGQAENALSVLDRLVAEYPDSAYRDEAEFRRGELLFLRQRYREAETAYAAVIAAGPASAYFEQSLYKRGWAFFKQSLYPEAVDDFLTLLDVRLTPQATAAGGFDLAGMSRAERELIDDTLRVLSISYAYLDGQEAIPATLDGHQEEVYGFLLYQSLGDLYLAKERYSDAAGTYEAFAARSPLHRHAPRFQLRVIEAYSQGGFPSLVLEAKQEFVTGYGLDAAYWELYPPASEPELVAALKTNLRDLAQHFHALAQQGKGEEDYARAVQFYRKYIQFFPEDPDTADTNFLLAELLFESGRYLEAVDEYERTAYGYGQSAKAAEAGYAALMAYGRVEEELPEEARDSWHRRAIQSGLKFARTYPDHPQAMAVLTKSSEDLFALGELDLAITVADQVIVYGSATGEQLRVAWTVKAHALFDLGRYGEAEASYLQLLALVPREDPDRGELVERVAASVYKQGEARRAEGDMAGAAMDFLRVAQVAPGASIVATAEYDAAAALVAAGDWGGAIPVLERYRQANPGAELAFEATRSLAVAYKNTGQGVAAADEFVRIANSAEAGSELRREALLEAADLYTSAGAVTQERDTLENYVASFPQPLDEAMGARQRLAELAEGGGDAAERRRWLTAIVDADDRAGATRTALSQTLAANASLELAEPYYLAFSGVKLVSPLQQSIRRKKDAMEVALAAYAKAADYGIAEVTTAATFHIADVYYQFSRALFDSERPADMSDEEAEQYDLLLEEQAYPFEEQAIDIHEANARRTQEGVYDEWVKKSFERLAVLMPARYDKAEKGVPSVANIY